MSITVSKHIFEYWKSLGTDIHKIEVLREIARYFSEIHLEQEISAEYRKLNNILNGIKSIKDAAGYLPPLIREYLQQMKSQLLYNIEEYEGCEVKQQIIDCLKQI